MIDREQAKHDKAALEIYEPELREAKTLALVMDFIETYREEIENYLQTGSYENLEGFVADIHATRTAIEQTVQQGIYALLQNPELYEDTVSLITATLRKLNASYSAATNTTLVDCGDCAGSRADVAQVEQGVRELLADDTTIRYFPERLSDVVGRTLDTMNTHILTHLTQE